MQFDICHNHFPFSVSNYIPSCGWLGERVRWTEASRLFEEQLDKLVGDVLLATGFLSYTGPFNQDFRALLDRDWHIELSKQGIPYSDVSRLSFYPSNHLPPCMRACLPVCLSMCVCVFVSVCLSVCLSIYSYVSQSVCTSFWPSVVLFYKGFSIYAFCYRLLAPPTEHPMLMMGRYPEVLFTELLLDYLPRRRSKECIVSPIFSQIDPSP